MELVQQAAHLYHSFAHLRHSLTDAHDEMAESVFQRATETVEYLRLKLPAELARPRVAIVCGSGLGGLADVVNQDEQRSYAYKDIPNFPQSNGRLDRKVYSWSRD